MSLDTPPCHQWNTFEGPLLDYIISQVLFYEPSTAVSLLQVNSEFHRAVVKNLYEELYIHDNNAAVHSPPRSTRLEATLRFSHKYADLVRTLIIVPAPLALQASISALGITLPCSSEVIQPENLTVLLKLLSRLENFVWATDRMPFHSICSVLNNSAPQLKGVLFRPTISELAHSRHRLASQESAFQGNTPSPHRWDAFMMLSLSSLRTLYISGLSVDGIRELHKLLQRSNRLSVLTVDSQFVDDALLVQVAELKCLQKLVIKTSGTKMTDKSLLAILEKSETLQSLCLTEVEGRLHRLCWSNAIRLPSTFETLRLALSEEGPHHSWIADHLISVFDILELAPNGLKTFSIIRLPPKGEIVPINNQSQEDLISKATSSGQVKMHKRIFSNPCDDVVRPRPFPNHALARIVQFGTNLEILELDMFVISIAELRVIVESCKKLQTLRVLLDASLSKVLTMSSALVSLTQLRTLVLSITDAHCPKQTLIIKTPSNGKVHSTARTPPTNTVSPSRRQSDAISPASVPDLSPASTHTSLAHSEAEPASPTVSPRRTVSNGRRSSVSATINLATNAKSSFDEIASISIQGIQGSVGSFDTSVPPKREIRKLARRCPNLRLIRWTGRNGKGEWRIAAGSSSIHAHIDFVPIHLVEDEELELVTLGSGADVEDFIKSRRSVNLPHPGKRGVVEQVESGVLTQKAEVSPRVDGRQFPRLKINTSQGSHVGEAITIDNAKGAGKKKSIIVAEDVNKQTAGVKTPVTTTLSCTTATNTPRKVTKSYADISDPAQIKKEEERKCKVDAKMTVLGDSNRKKAGSKGASTTNLTSTPPSGKQRTVTKVRGSEDVFSGATIIIGQGKATSSTKGDSARRDKKKAVTTKQSDENTVTASLTSDTPSPPLKTHNKNQGKRHL